jgi:hypothetical protein
MDPDPDTEAQKYTDPADPNPGLDPQHAYKYSLIDRLMKKRFNQPKFNPNVHTHGCQPAEGCQSENKINITDWPSVISRDTVTRAEHEKDLFSLES